MTLDLEAIKSMWLNQCGPCDYGMPEYGCTHPSEDYRLVIVELVREVERLRAVIAENPSWAAYLTVVDDAALRRDAEDLARDLRAARAEILRLGFDVVTAEQLSDAECERDEALRLCESAQQMTAEAVAALDRHTDEAKTLSEKWQAEYARVSLELAEARAEVERLWSALGSDHVENADVVGYVWRDPRTGGDVQLHPADVTVVLRQSRTTAAGEPA